MSERKTSSPLSFKVHPDEYREINTATDFRRHCVQRVKHFKQGQDNRCDVMRVENVEHMNA